MNFKNSAEKNLIQKRQGGDKCPPSSQLGLGKLLWLFAMYTYILLPKNCFSVTSRLLLVEDEVDNVCNAFITFFHIPEEASYS